MDYKDILPEEIKEAFRKGDAYYKSPFKGMSARKNLYKTSNNDTGSNYVNTTFAQIHEARMDRIASRSWN